MDNGDHLIFPYLHENIISDKKISNEEIKNANKCKRIKDLILPLININNITQNILAKFLGLIYALPTPFHKILNLSLLR